MIEILPDVWYNPDLPWYEQDEQLIELAEQVMQEPPIADEIETSGSNSRMIWGEWETTTTEGTFKMRVDMFLFLHSLVRPLFIRFYQKVSEVESNIPKCRVTYFGKYRARLLTFHSFMIE